MNDSVHAVENAASILQATENLAQQIAEQPTAPTDKPLTTSSDELRSRAKLAGSSDPPLEHFPYNFFTYQTSV